MERCPVVYDMEHTLSGDSAEFWRALPFLTHPSVYPSPISPPHSAWLFCPSQAALSIGCRLTGLAPVSLCGPRTLPLPHSGQKNPFPKRNDRSRDTGFFAKQRESGIPISHYGTLFTGQNEISLYPRFTASWEDKTVQKSPGSVPPSPPSWRTPRCFRW